mmetsp:Transcript_112909/g.269012  ORF Transcript_112909/g.269012 Transcript_112909/m.269012 type:complete len:332 (+) Transcript_112909:1192-2187(+)
MRGHDVHELFEVELVVAVRVAGLKHQVHVLQAGVEAHMRKHLHQLQHVNLARAIPIPASEYLFQLLHLRLCEVARDAAQGQHVKHVVKAELLRLDPGISHQRFHLAVDKQCHVFGKRTQKLALRHEAVAVRVCQLKLGAQNGQLLYLHDASKDQELVEIHGAPGRCEPLLLLILFFAIVIVVVGVAVRTQPRQKLLPLVMRLLPEKSHQGSRDFPEGDLFPGQAFSHMVKGLSGLNQLVAGEALGGAMMRQEEQELIETKRLGSSEARRRQGRSHSALQGGEAHVMQQRWQSVPRDLGAAVTLEGLLQLALLSCCIFLVEECELIQVQCRI